jgi:hypothetical protein
MGFVWFAEKTAIISLTALSDHFNGEVLCFLCGTNWILKYYLDKRGLQMFKASDNNLCPPSVRNEA